MIVGGHPKLSGGPHTGWEELEEEKTPEGERDATLLAVKAEQGPRARERGLHQELDKAKNGCTPRASRRSTALLNPALSH